MEPATKETDLNISEIQNFGYVLKMNWRFFTFSFLNIQNNTHSLIPFNSRTKFSHNKKTVNYFSQLMNMLIHEIICKVCSTREKTISTDDI